MSVLSCDSTTCSNYFSVSARSSKLDLRLHLLAYRSYHPDLRLRNKPNLKLRDDFYQRVPSYVFLMRDEAALISNLFSVARLFWYGWRQVGLWRVPPVGNTLKCHSPAQSHIYLLSRRSSPSSLLRCVCFQFCTWLLSPCVSFCPSCSLAVTLPPRLESS